MSDDKPTDTVDFFAKSSNADAGATQPDVQGGILREPTAPRQAKTAWADRIKPVHVVSTIFVVAIGWMFGIPALTGPAGHTPQRGVAPASSSSYFDDPYEEPTAAGPAQPVRGEIAASAPSPSPAPAPAPAYSAVAEDVTVLRGEVASLRAEVDAARQEMLMRLNRAASANQPTPRAPRRAHVDAKDREVLSAYRLNSVYRGQAWIEDGQRTYVVEPGSVIDGIRIDRIDAASRRVHTSKGEIR